ncbi:MAG: hypothetical protein RL092_111 [Bacteroidota bacterium]|jgi:hypothetical protein
MMLLSDQVKNEKMKKIILIISCVVSCIIQLDSKAQLRNIQSNSNGWLMYFGDHKISEKIGVHLEVQFRRNEIVLKPQQLLLRGGFNFHFTPNAFATAGYCFVNTSQYGVFPVKCAFPENRIWEQVQFKSQAGRIELITRLRLEQRFSKLPVLQGPGEYVPGDDVYTNRGRLFVRMSVPFKGKTIDDGSMYFSCYEEAFVNFGNDVQANIFDQNRMYAALGYKFSKWGKLEIGYMNQLLLKSDGIKIENNHTLQVGFSSTVDFYKKKGKS